MEASQPIVDTSDEALMLRFRDGEAEAFEKLYSRHKGGLYRYLLRQCHDPELCEELFQDVWLGLIRNRRRYQVKAKFSTYLYRMAHNRLIDWYRKKRPEALSSYADDPDPLDHIPAGDGLMPENVLEARQRAHKLIEALDALPAAQREAFLLREEAGFSVEEMAKVTGVLPETAKSRLRYAMNKLRKALEQM